MLLTVYGYVDDCTLINLYIRLYMLVSDKVKTAYKAR
jgi:hypothetical protein